MVYAIRVGYDAIHTEYQRCNGRWVLTGTSDKAGDFSSLAATPSSAVCLDFVSALCVPNIRASMDYYEKYTSAMQ